MLLKADMDTRFKYTEFSSCFLIGVGDIFNGSDIIKLYYGAKSNIEHQEAPNEVFSLKQQNDV